MVPFVARAAAFPEVPNFNPEFEEELYHDLPPVRVRIERWFGEELENIDHMALHPDASRRLHSDRLVVPESLTRR